MFMGKKHVKGFLLYSPYHRDLLALFCLGLWHGATQQVNQRIQTHWIFL